MNEINLPAEPEARENEVDSLLVDRVARFLSTHTLQFKVPKDSIDDLQTSLEEGKDKNIISSHLPVGTGTGRIHEIAQNAKCNNSKNLNV